MHKYLIIIPAYNPPARFADYAKSLSAAGITDLLVVDDGSRPEFAPLFDEVGALPGCRVLRHAVNLGKGRALKNAFNSCLNHPEYDGAITVDCDGQHTVEDVLRMRAAMEESEAHLFLGCRDFNEPNVPFKSRYGNKITCGVFRLLYGARFSDTQTGLRGFSRQAMADFIQLFGERFEFETNMLICCCRQKIPVQEIPIQTVYINENAETHFHPIKDSCRIYGLVFRSFFLYTLSALSSFLIDILLFTVLAAILPVEDTLRILIATVVARICSSVFNFTVNRKVVFSTANAQRGAFFRYYALCLVQMLLSAGLVAGVFALLDGSETLIKIVVDLLLAFFSYRVQQAWVFRAQKT